MEVWVITQSLHTNGDIIAGKIFTTLLKPAFWALGYLVIMPLSLLWAYSYFHNYLVFEVGDLRITRGGDNEMVPKLDRATTPFLDDSSYILTHGTSETTPPEESVDEWNLFKYKHQNKEPRVSDKLNKEESAISTAL